MTKTSTTTGVQVDRDALDRQFRISFPSGILRATDQTGQYAIKSGQRALRTPICSEAISQAAVLKHCRQEVKDQQTQRRLLDDAQRCGAREVRFEHSNALGVQVQYLSRTGFRRRDSIYRAQETRWGQTRQRKGQALAVITIKALCPADDWCENTRPFFLAQQTKRRLELDGYSPSLMLAIEYNGRQHDGPITKSAEGVETYRQVAERDRIKRLCCQQAGVTLIEMRQIDLDPELFLATLRKLLDACGIKGRLGDAEALGIRALWQQAYDNPLAEFQAGVLRGLRHHTLITPEQSWLTPHTTLTYQCGACGELNEANAKGLLQAHVRRAYCPQCKGSHQGKTRQAGTRETWIAQGVDRKVIDALLHENGKYVHRCGEGHRFEVATVNTAKRHTQDGRFVCPLCVQQRTGLHYAHAARIEEYQQIFAATIHELGLTVLEFLPRDAQTARAWVRCPEGHQYEIAQTEATLLQKGSVRTDRSIVPSACPQCCYPGVDLAQTAKLNTTVHHRLHILRGMYPKARYLQGFDPTGWAQEHFACGEHYSDGKEHPPIRISFRNLQREAKRSPQDHLCIACAYDAGQVSGRRKQLAGIAGLSKAMRDHIDRIVPLPRPLSDPTVEWASGLPDESGDVLSKETTLRFWCGVPGHAPEEATKDSYFNRALARGKGYCAQCVALTGQGKAPKPQALAPELQPGLKPVAVRKSR